MVYLPLDNTVSLVVLDCSTLQALHSLNKAESVCIAVHWNDFLGITDNYKYYPTTGKIPGTLEVGLASVEIPAEPNLTAFDVI